MEIYRVFPKDSDAVRTPRVPTRANSPSDVAFDSRDSEAGSLTYTTAVLSSSFTAANSVLNGIHPKPAQTTSGEGPVTGQEVRFAVDFTPPIALPADHYFFVPQVQLDDGNFFWLSAPKPLATDLQAWIRNGDLDPDWLKVGTDIVGAGAFNGTFALLGQVLSSPTSLFSTGNPDGKMAMASRPESGPNIEIEAADDFLFANPVGLTGATFVGLIPRGHGLQGGRGDLPGLPQGLGCGAHAQGADSRQLPSDVAFDSRDSEAGSLTYTTAVLSSSFTAANSVLNGIHPKPGQTTNGEGPVTGQEVQFTVTFAKPFLLPPTTTSSCPRCSSTMATSSGSRRRSRSSRTCKPGSSNGDLDPDWLKVGTDIVGAGAFNGTFALLGQVISSPLALSPAHLLIGLKNSDDQGTQFDLKVELLRNGTSVASGLGRCIAGVTRNPDLARDAVAEFDPFGLVPIASGDVLALRVSARIGTKPDDTKCSGPGGSHNSAVGLRLYYDATSRRSRFDATIAPSPEEDLFLHSDGTPCGARRARA